MIDWEDIKFSSESSCWIAKGNTNRVEVYIPDHLGSPDPEWLNYAELKLNLCDLPAIAKSFLDSMIKGDEEGFDRWHLEFIEFKGLFPEINRIWEMAFTLADDDYGLWIVTFCEQSPSTFRRVNS